MWKSKYLRKLMIFSMILVTLPVFSLGFLSYYKANHIIQDKVIQGNMQVLEQTQLKVEQLLQSIDASMMQFMNTSLITLTIGSDLDYRDFAKIYEVAEGVHKLQSYDLGIEEVQLVSFAGQWYFNRTGYNRLSTNEELKGFTSMASIPVTSQWQSDQEASKVRLIKKLPLNVMNNPVGLLVVTIPNYRLQKLVPAVNGDVQTVILDEDYRLLTAVDQPVFPAAVMDRIMAHLKATPGDQGFEMLDINKQSIGVSYRTSSYNGWTYVSIVSIAEITKESRAIGWYTVWICTGIFVVLLLLSLVGLRKIYMPIRRVFEVVVGADRSGPDKSQDELVVIGEHIRTLHHSQTQLLDQIQGQKRQLKEFFIRKLLLGEIGTKEIEEKAGQYHFTLDGEMLCIVTVQIDTFAGTRFRETDRDLLMFAVSNIVMELFPEQIRFDPVVLGGNQVTIFKLKEESPEAAKNEVFTWAEMLQSTVKGILGLSISIGISRFHSRLPLAESAYRESLEALKYRIRFGEEAILFLEDVLPDFKVITMYPEWIEKQLIEALNVPDLDKASGLLHEFLIMTLKETTSHQEYQMLLFRLLTDLIREVQNAGEQLPMTKGDDRELVEQLFSLRTVEDVEHWFMVKVLEPIVSVLGKKWDSRNKNISEQMKDIIHAEFESELTLDVCAARLNYHPNYLKAVFRKELGINFSDYLSQVRMNQARKWLLETDMKIVEIAERLQYQNPQNFIRSFRKTEDMTPGEYRKKYAQLP
ncbi:helix-turn-helix domain-containing protein [Paenibacillus sp. y28]|uniref:helix-turn-helix domain-containing protein n=1 Tax=Paenibacillus sp. y28 TaxID=3129110 RepID=UPI0030181BAC